MMPSTPRKPGDEAIVAVQSPSDRFQRLLHELTAEYAHVCEENAALHQEMTRLRSEPPPKCNETGEVTTQGEPAPQRPLSSLRPRGLSGYALESTPSRGSSVGGVVSGGGPPVLHRGWSARSRSLTYKNHRFSEFHLDEEATVDTQQVLPKTPGFFKEATTGSTMMMWSPTDWRNAEDRLQMLPSGQVPDGLAKQLKDQFDRLSNGQGVLTVQDCWEVVSHHEHQLYGHNKHSMRRVARTMRYMTMMHKMKRDPFALCSEETDVSDFSSAALSPPGGNSNAAAELDFEAFLHFMTGDEEFAGDDEGDFEYLKKAFRAEQNQNMAELARKAIARRAVQNVEPTPEGWMFLWLERLPPLVIFTNAVVLGLQADIERENMVWEVLELVFLAFYLLEFVLKVRLLGWYKFFAGLDWAWNWFDFMCIVLSLLDLSSKHILDASLSENQVTMVKVLRLARLARIIKSFRYKFFDDLRTMAMGVLSGARVLAWAVLLFFMGVFIIGVVMREVFETEEAFSTLPSAMFTVFRCFTDGCSASDGTPLHDNMRKLYGGGFMITYILVFLVVTFGIFNLIIAVFIESVSSTTIKRKQQELGRREEEMKMRIEETLVKLVHASQPHKQLSGRPSRPSIRSVNSVDLDKTDLWVRQQQAAEAMAQVRAERVEISRELFNAWLTDKEVLDLLEEVEIDTATKAEIFDVCDVDKSGSLTCDELVSGLMRLRGPISKCDVIAIRLKVRYLTKMLEDIHHVLGA